MILTVTLNPAIDVTYTVAELHLGASHRVDDATRRAGGKGVNVARVLVGQGIRAAAIACVDDGPTGTDFADELERVGVPHRLVRTASPTRCSLTIVDQATGRASVLNERGTHPGDEALEAVLSAVHREHDASCLVIAGSLPHGVGAEAVAAIVAAGRSRGLPVIVDGSGDVLTVAARAGASLLKPNAEELRDAVPGASHPVSAARELIQLGTSAVVVTLGEGGMVSVGRLGVRAARLPRILTGNPTGAGDAATAALAAHFARGLELEDDGLRQAVAWSASAVLAPLAGDLDPSWPGLLSEVEIHEVTADAEVPWPS